MSTDFYCDEVLSGRTPVVIVEETENVIAFEHTRPFFEVHFVVVPKVHIPSFLDVGPEWQAIFLELQDVIRRVARKVVDEHGAARILTNLGDFQESKHLHYHVYFGERIRPDNIPITTR